MATGYCLLSLSAEEIEIEPPAFPWSHSGWFDSVDHARYTSGIAIASLPGIQDCV